jgi:spore coat protein JB
MMHRDQLEMLKELQALEFTALDLHLYLNTHPNDQRALADYSRAIREAARVKNIYAVSYGPLMAEDNVNQACWKWIEEPWPWEIEY